ncbi:hypothetical protein EIJ81_00630 (plasmid) [Aliivibrio salmonicida]|uniref:hypothetical protein n=1 Tax=Aliivibrio salmonicida TaxID=40269 RepID=UPI000F6D3BE0|nr:hypothetical protein [Aliivibrio salmonicida]AZL83404.1 hypothetical protein EIJ81_00630 [Aliivibrio salmonicida]
MNIIPKQAIDEIASSFLDIIYSNISVELSSEISNLENKKKFGCFNLILVLKYCFKDLDDVEIKKLAKAINKNTYYRDLKFKPIQTVLIHKRIFRPPNVNSKPRKYENHSDQQILDLALNASKSMNQLARCNDLLRIEIVSRELSKKLKRLYIFDENGVPRSKISTVWD